LYFFDGQSTTSPSSITLNPEDTEQLYNLIRSKLEPQD
jgi:hypothetical protein